MSRKNPSWSGEFPPLGRATSFYPRSAPVGNLDCQDQLNESSPDLLLARISVRPPSPFVFITVAVYTYLVCFSLFHSACFKGTTFTLKAKRFYVLIMLTFHSFATSWREATSSGNAGDTLLTCACQWGHLTVSRPVWTGHYQSVSLTGISVQQPFANFLRRFHFFSLTTSGFQMLPTSL